MHQFSFQQRLEYLRQYGTHCMAYSTLQPGMRYFDVAGVGYLAYVQYCGTRHVLADPICHARDRERLLEVALRDHSDTCFVQVQQPTAKVLEEAFGYHASVLGIEATVPGGAYAAATIPPETEEHSDARAGAASRLAELVREKDSLYEIMGADPDLKKDFWRLKRKITKLRKTVACSRNEGRPGATPSFLDGYLRGGRMEFLRRQYAAAREAGVIVQEYAWDQWSEAAFRHISLDWLSTRGVSSREMRFLTRPLVPRMDADCGVRLFVAAAQKRPVGFLALDPIFSSGGVVGYYADILRTGSDSPRGTGYALLLHAMDRLFAEGRALFSLGLSPFAEVAPVYATDKGLSSLPGGHTVRRVDNPLVTAMLRTLFDHGQLLYDARGQHFHKSRFRGIATMTYYCTRGVAPMANILGGFMVSGISPLTQVRSLAARIRQAVTRSRELDAATAAETPSTPAGKQPPDQAEAA